MSNYRPSSVAGRGPGTQSARLIVSVVTLLTGGIAMAEPSESVARIDGDSRVEVTVGMSGVVNQVVLPGTELTAKEVDPRQTPIAIRIDKVYPHGDDIRYDLTFFGMEPGTHNLTDYLARKDGSTTDDLPVIAVTVKSVLPPDRMLPNELTSGFLASIGGYRTLTLLAVVGWVAGLIAILTVGRKQTNAVNAESQDEILSSVDHIRRLAERAAESGELTSAEKAELDMRVLEFWRDRRNLSDWSKQQSIVELKSDPEAGPLLNGIERWFYSRESPTTDELSTLLEPLRKVADDRPATAAR